MFSRRARMHRFVGCPLVATVVLVGLAAPAEAVPELDCQPSQYLDRTAPGADREILWETSLEHDPERCMQVQVGQTVIWNGDLVEMHPRGANGGDTPNPFVFNRDREVTFTTPGTFGYLCLMHQSQMRGA